MTSLIALAATSLAAAIWQSALLVLCVAVALRLLPGITAAARSLLWTAVFLVTLALPFVAHLSAVPSRAASAPQPSLHIASVWALPIASLWIILSVIRAFRLLQSALRLHRVTSNSTPIAATPDIAVLLTAANPHVSLHTSAEVDVPSLSGFFHPRILLPTTILAQVAPMDLRHIVLHELEHLRRRDCWTNLIQKCALVLFPLNPVLLWVERRLCLERELACDDRVLQATGGAAKAYATCLANLAEASLLRRGLALALGAWGDHAAWHRRSELTRRIHRILRTPARQMHPAQSAVVAAMALAATLSTGLLVARSPQLITFANTPVLEATAASIRITPAFHPTLVKATLPQPHPAVTKLIIPHRSVRHSRTFAIGTPRFAATPNIVLIGWQPDVPSAPRWAEQSSFRLAYAAVPTRTGWLVFQL